MISRALKWLFCTASHNSVENAPPGQMSLCKRKHRRLRGEASRKETRRTACSVSLGSKLWHTNTSYFRLHRSDELRADCSCGGLEGVVPGDDDVNEDDKLLTEVNEFFVTLVSCSHVDDDSLDFKSFWNQPETERRQSVYISDLILTFKILKSQVSCELKSLDM